jgi:ABC-2 type transport system permease protein
VKHLRVILEKEWAELFRNRIVLATLAVLPLGFTLLGVTTLATTSAVPMGPGISEDLPQAFRQICDGLDDKACMQLYLGRTFLVLFMMAPLLLPTGAAAHSIVGEKVARTLEPVLATPVSTVELLAGKVLAAVIPACIVTWIGFFVYAGALSFIVPPEVGDRLFTVPWLAVIFLLAPLLSFLGVSIAVIVSSRATDPRTAEQISGLLVLPAVLVLVGQIAGLLVLSPSAVVVVALLVALVDIALLAVAVWLFDRENILTRWR